jgi:tight adherence protein C
MIIIISFLVFLIVFICAYFVIDYESKNNLLGMRIKEIENLTERRTITERRTDVEKVLAESFSQRILVPLGQRFSITFQKITPKELTQLVEKRLLLAGGIGGLSAGEFIAVSGIIIGFLVVVTFLISVLLKYKIMQVISRIFYAIILGLFVPHFVLSRKITRRQESIQRELPDVLDLVTVSVEAGLSFDGALDKLAEKMKGVLVEEFSQVLQQMRMGVIRRDALKEMSNRCGNKDLSLFVTALVQADQLGVSIGSLLRTQSNSIRESRKQQIEAKATKAPVLMLFPIVVCIVPTLFIVILGPAVIMLAVQLK